MSDEKVEKKVCSFCNKNEDFRSMFIEGEQAACICELCIGVAVQIMAKRMQALSGFEVLISESHVH